MSIKEHLALLQPTVVAVKVTVREYCDSVHPPQNAEWSYTESAPLDYRVLAKLFHDETSYKTANFSVLDPILKTLNRKVSVHTGKLPPYQSDLHSVKRSFTCEVCYSPEA